ncbi:MAG: methylated-DNA--[protein]-cysteine S-methyltransferase [Mariniblastus sp.]|nr:methylated-DNA--[protein]-cysteine S-methyltransferase [Mariniblastus sp.]
MNQINVQYYKTKIGELIQGSYSGKLCLLDFRYRRMRTTVDNRLKKGLNAEFVEQNDDVLSQTRIQLDEYINGDRTCFDIPILMVGTEFQKDVWIALMQVPYGKTNTYLDLAKTINNEKSVRAVASANGANSIALIIPCHRIIGSDGELVGYGGGIQIKKRLLKLEQNNQPQDDDWKYNFIGCRSVKYDGLFFTAVKTTGVFCKPSCSARKPNRENVIFYDTKEVAIENRFRACKICKP